MWCHGHRCRRASCQVLGSAPLSCTRPSCVGTTRCACALVRSGRRNLAGHRDTVSFQLACANGRQCIRMPYLCGQTLGCPQAGGRQRPGPSAVACWTLRGPAPMRRRWRFHCCCQMAVPVSAGTPGTLATCSSRIPPSCSGAGGGRRAGDLRTRNSHRTELLFG